MDPIDGKFTAFGWQHAGHQRQRHGRGRHRPEARPRRQGAADLHRLADPQGPGHPAAPDQAGRRQLPRQAGPGQVPRRGPAPRSPRGPRRACSPAGADTPISGSRNTRRRTRRRRSTRSRGEPSWPEPPPRSSRNGSWARPPATPSAGALEALGRRAPRPRRGRRRRGQLDPHRVVRQEVPRPVLQHRHRREQPRRRRRRPGQRGQDEPDRQLRRVHHLQRLRPAADVGRLSRT